MQALTAEQITRLLTALRLLVSSNWNWRFQWTFAFTTGLREADMRNALITAIGTLLVSSAAGTAADLTLYGPGGPAPAMKEIAAAYEKEKGVSVEVIAGPSAKWIEDAKGNADVLFSGSENMMDAFIRAHGNALPDTVEPLYLRPSALLVRKGNPKGIDGIRSLLEEDIAIMVVDGAGQVGMWEDVVGRTRDVDSMRKFRDNISFVAPNSGAAMEKWVQDESLDAWLIWNHWQIDNPDVADLVSTEPDLTIYRDVAVVTTRKGSENDHLGSFLQYLKSKESAIIFADHGWQRAF